MDELEDMGLLYRGYLIPIVTDHKQITLILSYFPI